MFRWLGKSLRGTSFFRGAHYAELLALSHGNRARARRNQQHSSHLLTFIDLPFHFRNLSGFVASICDVANKFARTTDKGTFDSGLVLVSIPMCLCHL